MPEIPFSPRQRVLPEVQRMPRASAEAAAAPFEALAQAGRVVSDIGGQIARFREEKKRVEQKAINQEMQGKMGVAKAEYEAGLLGRKDYNAMGNLDPNEGPIDQALVDYREEMAGLISDDPRLKKYDGLKNSLMLDLNTNIQLAGISGKKSGAKQLKDYGMAVADTNVDMAVKSLDYELAVGVVEDGRGTLYSDREADEKLVEIPSRIAMQSFENVYTQNPKQAIKGLDDGNYDEIIIGYKTNSFGEIILDDSGLPTPVMGDSNLTEKDKRTMRSFAVTEQNKRTGDNADDISNRLNLFSIGQPKNEEEISQIQGDLRRMQANESITPSDFKTLWARAKDPFGTGASKNLPAADLSVLSTKFSAYDVSADPTRSEMAKLRSELSKVTSARDYSWLKGILDDSEKGIPQSVHYDDIEKQIDKDASPTNIFGQRIEGGSVIQSETAVRAKRMIAKHLREKPEDGVGARRMYNEIVKADKDGSLTDFYIKYYGNGSQKKTISMISPAGKLLEVPSADVDRLTKLGAKPK